MKIEEKIIKLMTEHLQKIDRKLDRMDKRDSVFEKQFKVIEDLQRESLEHSKRIESLQKESSQEKP